MPLTRRDVLAGAFDILDSYGLSDLTMRRLASTLGVQPGGLYWHFDNKQSLLTAMADQILPAGSAPIDGTWREQLTRLVRDVRESLLSHRDGAELVAAVQALRMGNRATLTQLTEVMTAAGLDRARASSAAGALFHFVLGQTADEQSSAQLRELGVISASEADDPAEMFDFGLSLFLDGLALTLSRT